MRLLIALFALVVSTAQAQESYVDSVVSTTNVTATTVQAKHVSATGVSATFFQGDGSLLTNIPGGGSTSGTVQSGVAGQVGVYTGTYTVSGSNSLSIASVSGTYVYANQASATTLYTGAIKEGVVTVNASSGTTLLTFGAGSVVSGTISANTIISFTTPAIGQANQLTWHVTQDASGGRTINYPANVKWNGAIPAPH